MEVFKHGGGISSEELASNFYLFPLLPLLFGIAFHLQLVLRSCYPIFLRPYHFLKLVSFLGANRTKSASVGPRLLRGPILEYYSIQSVDVKLVYTIPVLTNANSNCDYQQTLHETPRTKRSKFTVFMI